MDGEERQRLETSRDSPGADPPDRRAHRPSMGADPPARPSAADGPTGISPTANFGRHRRRISGLTPPLGSLVSSERRKRL